MRYILPVAVALCGGCVAGCSDDDDPSGEQPVVVEPLPTPTLRFGDSVDSYDGSDIPVLTEHADTIHFRYSLPQGATDAIDPSAVWQKVAVDAATDSTVIHIDLAINLEKRVKYVMEAYASATKDKESARSEVLSKSFQSLRSRLVELSDIQVGPAAVVFHAEIVNVEGKADGYYYDIFPEGEYNKESFLASYEYAELIAESGKQKRSYNLLPGNNYILAVAPVKADTNSWGGTYITEVAGEISTANFTTPPYVLNTADASVAMEVTAANYESVSISVSADDRACGFYYGAVKTEDMNGATLEDYLARNDWFATHASSMSNYASFVDFNGVKQAKVSAKVSKLKESTGYTVFAIAADTVGTPGKMVSATCATTPLTFDSKASVKLRTVSAEYQSVTLGCDFLNGCTHAAYAYALASDKKTDAEGLELALANVSDESYHFTGDDVTLFNLSASQEYTLFVLPIDADGKFGAMQKYSFSTKSVSFTGQARVSAVITASGSNEYGATYSITITKGSGCAKFYYYYIYDAGEGLSDEEYATRILLSYYLESDKDTVVYDIETYGEPYKVAVVPVDAAGNNGTPVILSCPGTL